MATERMIPLPGEVGLQKEVLPLVISEITKGSTCPNRIFFAILRLPRTVNQR